MKKNGHHSTAVNTSEPCAEIVGLESMRTSAQSAAQLLRILANSDRLLLLCRLTEGEANVGDLEASVKVTQPTLSQQLGVLRRKKLVSTRREGKHIYYQVRPGATLEVLKAIHRVFCNPSEKSP